MRNLRQKEVKWHNSSVTKRMGIEMRKPIVSCESRKQKRMWWDEFFLFSVEGRAGASFLLLILKISFLPLYSEKDNCWTGLLAEFPGHREEKLPTYTDAPQILCRAGASPTWHFFAWCNLWDVPLIRVPLLCHYIHQQMIVEWLNGWCLNCMLKFCVWAIGRRITKKDLG